MKEYTAKEMKLLKANPYTFKVTKTKLYFTTEFKDDYLSIDDFIRYMLIAACTNPSEITVILLKN